MTCCRRSEALVLGFTHTRSRLFLASTKASECRQHVILGRPPSVSTHPPWMAAPGCLTAAPGCSCLLLALLVTRVWNLGASAALNPKRLYFGWVPGIPHSMPAGGIMMIVLPAWGA